MDCKIVGPKKADEREARVEGENREGSEHIAEGKARRNQIKLKG